jgi:hypothetical protein
MQRWYSPSQKYDRRALRAFESSHAEIELDLVDPTGQVGVNRARRYGPGDRGPPCAGAGIQRFFDLGVGAIWRLLFEGSDMGSTRTVAALP